MYMVVDINQLKLLNEEPKAKSFAQLQDAEAWVENIKTTEGLSTHSYHIFFVSHPDAEEYRWAFMSSPHDVFEKRDEFEKLSISLLCEVGYRKFTAAKRRVKQEFVDNKIDLEKYPKISKGFDFQNL